MYIRKPRLIEFHVQLINIARVTIAYLCKFVWVTDFKLIDIGIQSKLLLHYIVLNSTSVVYISMKNCQYAI